MIKAIRYLAALGLGAVMLFSPLTVHAEGQCVFDDAGVLDAQEAALLEVDLASVNSDTGWNVAVITTNDAQGKSAQAYADDFYDALYGINTDGVVYLIDFDNRENAVSTSGEAINYLTDSRIESILDETTPPLGKGNYAEAMQAFVQEITYYYGQGIPEGQYQYDSDTGETSYYHNDSSPAETKYSYPSPSPGYEAETKMPMGQLVGIGVLLGGITAIIAIAVILHRYKFHSIPGAVNYMNRSETVFQEQTDTFMRQYVNRVRIRQDPPPGGGGGGGMSSTHTSSGGGTHGGGSRGF